MKGRDRDTRAEDRTQFVKEFHMVMKRISNPNGRTEIFEFHGFTPTRKSAYNEPIAAHRVVLQKISPNAVSDASRNAFEGVVGRVARVSAEAAKLRTFADRTTAQRKKEMAPHYAEARRAVDTALTLLLPMEGRQIANDRAKLFELPSSDSNRAREIRERFHTLPPAAKADLLVQIATNDPAVRHIIEAVANDPFATPVRESMRTILRTEIEAAHPNEIAALAEREVSLETAYSGVAALKRVLDATEHEDLTTFDAQTERVAA